LPITDENLLQGSAAARDGARAGPHSRHPAIQPARRRRTDGLACGMPCRHRRCQIPGRLQALDYVNPDAPKRGVGGCSRSYLRQFQPGDRGLKGSIAGGATLINQTLRPGCAGRAVDGLRPAPEAAAYPGRFFPRHLSLECAARWHDGKPVTPDDVIFLSCVRRTVRCTAPTSAHLRCEQAGSATSNSPRLTRQPRLPSIAGEVPVLRSTGGKVTDAGQQAVCHGDDVEIPLGSAVSTGVCRGPHLGAGTGRDYWVRTSAQPRPG